jgi:hypothetical protein
MGGGKGEREEGTSGRAAIGQGRQNPEAVSQVRPAEQTALDAQPQRAEAVPGSMQRSPAPQLVAAVQWQSPPVQALLVEHWPAVVQPALHSPVDALQRSAPQIAPGLVLQLGRQMPSEPSVVTLLQT